jgi:hypothetical protein
MNSQNTPGKQQQDQRQAATKTGKQTEIKCLPELTSATSVSRSTICIAYRNNRQSTSLSMIQLHVTILPRWTGCQKNVSIYLGFTNLNTSPQIQAARIPNYAYIEEKRYKVAKDI